MRRRVALGVAVCAIVAAAWLLRRRQESTALAREALAYAPAPAAPREHPRPLPTPGQGQAAPEGPAPKALPSELDRAVGPPRWQPRPAEEWQGMRVNLNVTPPCERPDGCGMALACKGSRCGPCEFDAECATGESCVLDHCLKASNVECHHRADCGADSVCLLSGYSKGYRGNEDMRARCVALQSGADRMAAPASTGPAPSQQRPSDPDSDLMKAASKARQQ